MNTCSAFKVDGARCTHAPALPTGVVVIPAHLHFCRLHQGIYARNVQSNEGHHHVAGRCLITVGTHHRWCTQLAIDQTGKCTQHTEAHTRAAARRDIRTHREQRRRAALDYFRLRQPRPTWQQVARELHAPDAPEVINNPDINQRDILRAYYINNHTHREPVFWAGGNLLVADYDQWLRAGRVGREPVGTDYMQMFVPLPPVIPRAPPTLGAIAMDTQNVHRAVVSDQTNRSTDLLLATPDVHENVRAHELLAATWLTLRVASWSHVRTTVDDVVVWRSKETCRTQGDWLYRRLLHCLFMRIYRMPEGETRRELWKRFYEECSEAVGLCCEGHISRLCNVLVGFDDAFKPPVPLGELLQARMSAISEMDVSLDAKVKLATEFFTEHNVPEDQRSAWLEAF